MQQESEEVDVVLEHMRRTVSSLASFFTGPFVRFLEVFDLREPELSEQSQIRECDGR